MHSNSIAKLFTAIVGCLLSVFLIYQILYSRTGGVAMLITCVGIAGAIAAVVNPKTGLYLTAISTAYVDFGKQVAVYYGEVSQLTIIQVLLVSIACLGGTYLGIFFRAVVFRTLKLQRSDVALFGLTAGICAILFGLNRHSGTAMAAQLAINAGLFVGLIPTVAILLKEKEEVLKFVRFLFWTLLPWPIWGIRQHFWGFNQLEWDYALTGLSPTTSSFMLSFADPAPTGFGSNPGSYSIITLFVPLGLWHAFHYPKRRLLYLLAAVVYYAGCIFSEHRTVLFFPFIALAFYWFCLRPRRTVAAYVLGLGLFVLGVGFAGYLDQNIARISDFTRSLVPNEWGQTALSLETFSDRLKGWQRLAEPESYSLVGRLGGGWTGPETTAEASQEYNHDIINKILINFGVVGLITIIITAWFLLRSLHRLALRTHDADSRSFAAILVACVLPMIFLSFIGGGNLNTNPHNLIYWSLLGAALAMSRLDAVSAPADDSASAAPTSGPQKSRWQPLPDCASSKPWGSISIQ
ncbi:MAG TPA: hypothetical protein VIU12_20490 [Chryseolinea sp.]